MIEKRINYPEKSQVGWGTIFEDVFNSKGHMKKGSIINSAFLQFEVRSDLAIPSGDFHFELKNKDKTTIFKTSNQTIKTSWLSHNEDITQYLKANEENYYFTYIFDGTSRGWHVRKINLIINYTEPSGIKKIYIGNQQIQQVYIGTTPVKGIYIGTTCVYK